MEVLFRLFEGELYRKLRLVQKLLIYRTCTIKKVKIVYLLAHEPIPARFLDLIIDGAHYESFFLKK